MNKYSQKVDKMRVDRGWSIYKLAKEAGLSESTLNKWLAHDSEIVPTLPALEQICEAFKISLTVFFSDGNLVEIAPDLKELCDSWPSLTDTEKQSVMGIVKSYILKNRTNL